MFYSYAYNTSRFFFDEWDRVDERVENGSDRVVVDVDDDVELGAPADVVVVGDTEDAELEEERVVEALIEVEEAVVEWDIDVEVRSSSRAPPGAVLITFWPVRGLYVRSSAIRGR